MEASHSPTLARQCGSCAMCCKLGEIPQVKPYNQWCIHCSTREGCDIYATRPQPCRDFYCHYLLSDVGEEWYPKTCGMVVSTYEKPTRLTVSVDPANPNRWRESPYIEQITHWSNFGAVTVMVGEHAYAVYPDRIDDLGEITAEYAIEITELETRAGRRYELKRVRKL